MKWLAPQGQICPFTRRLFRPPVDAIDNPTFLTPGGLLMEVSLGGRAKAEMNGYRWRIYNGPASSVVQWIGMPAFVLAIPLVVLNGVRAWLLRSRSLIFLSVGLTVAGGGLLWLTFDYTFTYCWLTGVDLPQCLFGCAH